MSEPAFSGRAFVCQRVAGFVTDAALDAKGFQRFVVSCLGQVGTGAILDSFAQGFSSVALLGCPEADCRHESGSRNARTEAERARRLLATLGLPPQAVRFVEVSGRDDVDRSLTALPGRPVSFFTSDEEPAGLTEFRSDGFVCIECGRCSGVCPVSRAGLGFSPRRVITQALSAHLPVSPRMLYSCLLCARCATVCPSGKSIVQEVLRLRAAVYQHGARPVLAHTGTLQTLERMLANSGVPQNRLYWLTPELKVQNRGEVALWTGCAPYFEVLFEHLGVSPLRTVRNAVHLLNRVGVTPVVLADERCCGYDLLALGDLASVRKLARRNLQELRAAGVKKVVFLCPDCLRTFKVDYPALVGETGVEVFHISEFLLEHGYLPGSKAQPVRVTYQDPCQLGRVLGIYDAPRRLLTGTGGVELSEMAHTRDQALCCGNSAWLECGLAVKLLQDRRLAEAQAAGAAALVTACPRCEIHLRCAQTGRGKNPGVRVLNLVDFLTERG